MNFQKQKNPIFSIFLKIFKLRLLSCIMQNFSHVFIFQRLLKISWILGFFIIFKFLLAFYLFLKFISFIYLYSRSILHEVSLKVFIQCNCYPRFVTHLGIIEGTWSLLTVTSHWRQSLWRLRLTGFFPPQLLSTANTYIVVKCHLLGPKQNKLQGLELHSLHYIVH